MAIGRLPRYAMIMIRNALTVGVWTLGSRLLGFVRDILIAIMLGAGPAADAFFVALRLPNLFRRLFGEGAFSAAFVPEYTGRLAQAGEVPAQRLAEEITAFMAVWLVAITVVGMIFMPLLLHLLAPGFTVDPAKFSLTIHLARITFPYVLLICLSALFAGVLNARGHFAAAASAPILFNICIIGTLLLLYHAGVTPADALSYGVVLAGILQLLLLSWALLRAGTTIRLVRPRLTPGAKIVLRRLGPGLIGASVTQLNLTVDTIIASLLPTGTVSVLYYADRVNQLPLGVIGAALGTVLLPTLSRAVRVGEHGVARETLNRAIQFSLLFTLPSATALAIIGLPIMQALFNHGAFTSVDAARSAAALAAYAFGLPAFVLIKLFTPGFFARGDTKTPVKIGFATVTLNLALNLALMYPLQQVGIALSTSLAAWFNSLLLGFFLSRRGDFVIDRRLVGRTLRTVAACLVMTIILLLLNGLEGGASPHDLNLIILILVGLASFSGAALALGALRIDELTEFLSRRPKASETKLDPARGTG